ncbi:hypothetical protein [Pedobacter sp. L105]|uniref:hypothetical protein n=1 Tax=Pedobacter sp. L105 TaxID=1641871 RepID=UPI00131B0D00|nr:hypothetical protein [Pedobacter sp. L105]
MRKYAFISAICFFLFTIISKKSFSQTSSDSSAHQTALNGVIKFFNASLGAQLPIYNGRHYDFYDAGTRGSAYFQETDAFSKGSVVYDHTLYTDIPMIYDVYGNKLVILLYDQNTMCSLINDRVKSFDYLNHHFINIQSDTLTNNKAGMKSGFYDEVYSGKIETLVKRSKGIQEYFQDIEQHFTSSKDFYIKKNNVYYNIGSLSDLLDVLKDRRQELQHYVNTNKLKFRKDPEDVIVKISSYYDHLAN